MIDELLEQNIKSLKEVLTKDNILSTDSIVDRIEREVGFLLKKIMEIFNHLMNRDKAALFRSFDRVIELLKVTSDLEIVSICLNIISSNLSNTREPHISAQNYFRDREEDVTKLFYYCKFILDHNNSTSNSNQSSTTKVHKYK